MTSNDLELLPDPNAGSDDSARSVVSAANMEVVAVLSRKTIIYYNTYFTCTHHEIITLLSLLLYSIGY